jgi:hypothetical protein
MTHGGPLYSLGFPHLKGGHYSGGHFSQTESLSGIEIKIVFFSPFIFRPNSSDNFLPSLVEFFDESQNVPILSAVNANISQTLFGYASNLFARFRKTRKKFGLPWRKILPFLS